jgi:hypothetical protein
MQRMPRQSLAKVEGHLFEDAAHMLKEVMPSIARTTASNVQRRAKEALRHEALR